MRADMAKVLVERPRPGSRTGHLFVKGYRKRVARSVAADATVTREGMTRPYRHTKPFNENLAPLKRFVLSRVGRPWDAVHAELCSRIDRGNVVQKHILTHLSDYVLTQTVLIDGVPCYADGKWAWRGQYGRPLRDLDLRQVCYVCPKTGLLRRVPARRKPPAGPPTPPAYVRVSGTLQCRWIAGRWELVTLAPVPVGFQKVSLTDAVTGRAVCYVTEEEARRTYGAAVYATARRVLSKREQKRYPIPVEFVR